MSWIGVLGVVLGLLFGRVAFLRPTQTRVLVFLAAYIAHVGAAVVYYQYALTTSADSALYYYAPMDLYRAGFGLGTQFLIVAVQFMRENVGGTYLDFFLLFQALGFGGIALLMRTIDEIYHRSGSMQPTTSYLLVFLPGLHFWTSAIGKDALMFLACSLVVWAVMRLHSRVVMFGLGIGLMVLVRPHIALIALVALTLAVIFDRRAKVFTKLTLLAAAFVAMVYVAATVENSLQVNVGSASSVGEFFERQSRASSNMGGTSAVIDAPFPIKMLSLLFRPLFIDARGVFGLISSMENLVMMYIVFTLIRKRSILLSLARSELFIRYFIFVTVLLLFTLTLVYYNVGLGLRQRTMFMPALLSLFATVLAVRGTQPQPAYRKWPRKAGSLDERAGQA